MLRAIRRHVLVIGMLAVFTGPAAANTITFEGLAEFDAVTTQFAGVTFSNATVLTAGTSLNEFDNPPNSGSNVVFDDGGFISIMFASPVSDFGGYFTYALTSPGRLTLTAFDSANAPLGVTLSAFSNNQGTVGEGGSSPNEFLQLLFSNISSVQIAGELSGGSFTLDDVTYTTATAVPDASSTRSLLVFGFLVLHATSRRLSMEKRT